jgi:bifunctional non-homologous end joining protein LigD
VLIDWSQIVASKTTVSVYSLRARPEPTVSTPVTWDEVDDALAGGDASRLSFQWPQVLERVQRRGDLMSDVLTRRQELPDLSS